MEESVGVNVEAEVEDQNIDSPRSDNSVSRKTDKTKNTRSKQQQTKQQIQLNPIHAATPPSTSIANSVTESNDMDVDLIPANSSAETIIPESPQEDQTIQLNSIPIIRKQSTSEGEVEEVSHLKKRPNGKGKSALVVKREDEEMIVDVLGLNENESTSEDYQPLRVSNSLSTLSNYGVY